MTRQELNSFLKQEDKTSGPWCVSSRGQGEVCICMGTNPDDHGPVLFILKPIQFGCFEMTPETLAKCGDRIVRSVNS
jgi:hypothetical protein